MLSAVFGQSCRHFFKKGEVNRDRLNKYGHAENRA
jgi:hypothetical protein